MKEQNKMELQSLDLSRYTKNINKENVKRTNQMQKNRSVDVGDGVMESTQAEQPKEKIILRMRIG